MSRQHIHEEMTTNVHEKELKYALYGNDIRSVAETLLHLANDLKLLTVRNHVFMAALSDTSLYRHLSRSQSELTELSLEYRQKSTLSGIYSIHHAILVSTHIPMG